MIRILQYIPICLLNVSFFTNVGNNHVASISHRVIQVTQFSIISWQNIYHRKGCCPFHRKKIGRVLFKIDFWRKRRINSNDPSYNRVYRLIVWPLCGAKGLRDFFREEVLVFRLMMILVIFSNFERSQTGRSVIPFTFKCHCGYVGWYYFSFIGGWSSGVLYHT